MQLPLPDTGLEARIQDLEIIATGDVDKIGERIRELEEQKNKSENSSERAALDSRIAVLRAAYNKATAAVQAADDAKAAKTAAEEAKKAAKAAKTAAEEAKKAAAKDANARSEDLKIILSGKVDDINKQKAALEEQLNNPNLSGEEKAALKARIAVLADAATRVAAVNDAIAKTNKKDKGSKKSADDLASWSGRVANASTNAFSASVNGVSVGLTGMSFSGAIYSLSFNVFAHGTSAGKFGTCGFKNKAAVSEISVKANEINSAVSTIEQLVTKINNKASLIANSATQITNALFHNAN